MTDLLALTEDEQRSLPIAQSYIRTRFYPPLPSEYGALAIIALRQYREHGPEARVALPDDLKILPSRARRDDDGDLFVEASVLIENLRIGHLLDVDDEED